MAILVTGIAVWAFVHLFPSVAPDLRSRLIDRLGANPYRGLFSVLIVISLVLIVVGWQSTQPQAVYRPPVTPGALSSILMLLSFVLFVAARAPTNIRRFLRHPQLTGVLLWSIAHLLVNGDNRSLTLFGSFAVWTILEMLLINRRDGAWQKSEPVTLVKDAITVGVGAVVYVIVFLLHPLLFGVSAVPH